MLRDFRLLLLLIAGSLTTMAGGVVAPILPEMVQQLDLDPGLAANLVSIHCLTIALFSLPLGIVADRFGRLRVLIPSLIFYAVFGTSGAFMPNFDSLLVTRALLGAASGGIAAASLGLLGSMYEGEARSQALGYATSTLTIAGILFPLLGGWVGAINWQFTFYLYGLGLPLACLVSFILKEKPPQRTTKTNSPKPSFHLRQVLSHSPTLWLLLAIGLTSVAMYAVVIYAPLYLKATIGAGAILNGIVLAVRAVGAAAVSAFAIKSLIKKFGLLPITIGGFGLMAFTLATIPLLHEFHWILLTAVLFGVGFGIVLPSLYSALANLAPAKVRATLLAAGTGAGFLGQFFSPILLKPVLDSYGFAGVFYAAAIVSIIAGLCLILLNQNPGFRTPLARRSKLQNSVSSNQTTESIR